MAVVDLNSQFNFLTQMKEFQLQTERYIDRLDEHLQAHCHKPKTLPNEQKSAEIPSEKKVPPSATKSALAAKLGYMYDTIIIYMSSNIYSGPRRSLRVIQTSLVHQL